VSALDRRPVSIRKCLATLEHEVSNPEPPWSPPEVYARLRREARAEIELAREDGEEPRYWIDAEGIVHTADDDRIVRHYGDYLATIHREISRLRREIETLEREIAKEQGEDRFVESVPHDHDGSDESSRRSKEWWRRREERIRQLELQEGEGVPANGALQGN
jgi:hypothetical protein